MSASVTTMFAFLAGVASFLSPCVLPLIPSYLSYMTGLSVKELQTQPHRNVRSHMGIHALLFVCGFSFVFITLGATASALGQRFAQYQTLVQRIGGALIIFLGLYLTGVVKVGFLSKERKFSLPHRPIGFVSSFLVGVVFAFGWTPCVGPILASILVLAGTTEDLQKGVYFLTIYSLGLGVPFILSAFAVKLFFAYAQKIKQYLRWMEVGSGIILIGIGILLASNLMLRLTSYLNQVFAPLTEFFSL